MFSAVQLRSHPAVALLALCLSAAPCFAGGVHLVAGDAFDPEVRGKPLTWPGGSIQYYTDLGPLGSLNNIEANSFVDDVFSRWASVSTAALTATRAGSLEQDVSGSNVFVANGTLILPPDIQPTATHKPIAIVYDHDGSVVDTLLGVGASAPAECLQNGVIGGTDAHNSAANYAHALIVVNGRCIAGPDDMLRMRYLLLRVIGRTLGLGWSQLNDNLATGVPPPTTVDAAGLPVMHPLPLLCGPTFPGCTPDAADLRMDDRAAISRLYPVNSANLVQFPGKQSFAEVTAQIHGSVRFTLPESIGGEPMQGVNVVARLIEGGIPSRVVAASSVSGFLFRGHAGNRATGTDEPGAGDFNDFGSQDSQFRGYFDLAGLELPSGTTATYELSIEPVNSLYVGPKTVGPYRSGSVSPSGSLAPVKVQVEKGGSLIRNLEIADSAKLPKDRLEPNLFHSVPEVPASGEWYGSISGYGDEDFFRFRARGGRTLHLRVTAVDHRGNPTRQKLLPVLGAWLISDAAQSPPQIAAIPLNSVAEGATDLTAMISADSLLKLGIMDDRGDGRPDFLYRAKLLYVDSASPSRVGEGQSADLVLRGIGFRPGMTVKIGQLAAFVRYVRSREMGITVPVQPNGVYAISVSSADGAQAEITSGVTYGSTDQDVIANLSTPNPVVAVGTVAPNPMRVRVTNNGEPVASAVVNFSITPTPSQLSCGSATCAIVTDNFGEASVRAAANTAGANTITAQLDSGASVASTIQATSSGATLVASTPFISILAGDSLSLPISMHYALNGVASSGTTLAVGVAGAGATLTSHAPVTNGAGVATTTLNVANTSLPINVTGCVTATATCAQVSVQPLPPASLQIVSVSGDRGRVLVGATIPPMRFRVMATTTPFTHVTQAPVSYTMVVSTPNSPITCPPEGACTRQNVRLLANVTGSTRTDANGLLELIPAIDPAWGPVHVTLRVAIAEGPERRAEFDVVAPSMP